MKTSIPLTLIGAACTLLASCGTSTRETVFVTTESGAPICGAYLDPCVPPLGCEDIDYSNGCGELTINGDNTFSLKKDGFRTVNGITRIGQTQRVIMVPGEPM